MNTLANAIRTLRQTELESWLLRLDFWCYKKGGEIELIFSVWDGREHFRCRDLAAAVNLLLAKIQAGAAQAGNAFDFVAGQEINCFAPGSLRPDPHDPHAADYRREAAEDRAEAWRDYWEMPMGGSSD